MEKELRTLTIDLEFRDLISPLTDEEREMLEASILKEGCETPLTIWNETIVDGHNRYEICQKHGIPFAVSEKLLTKGVPGNGSSRHPNEELTTVERP